GGAKTIHRRRDAQGVEWSGPAVGGPVQLAYPLIGPSGHDGLAGGVLRSRVVEAPFGAALGVTAVPGRGIDSEHQGPLLGTVLDQQLAEPNFVYVSRGQGLVEAAVAAPELGFETEGGHRSDRGR